jgi:hypothetical protein
VAWIERNRNHDRERVVQKLRLVKVVVQPVFLLDDGEHLTEVEHPAVAIPAAEWPAYSAVRFPAELAEWEARLNAQAGAAPEHLEGES